MESIYTHSESHSAARLSQQEVKQESPTKSAPISSFRKAMNLIKANPTKAMTGAYLLDHDSIKVAKRKEARGLSQLAHEKRPMPMKVRLFRSESVEVQNATHSTAANGDDVMTGLATADIDSGKGNSAGRFSTQELPGSSQGSRLFLGGPGGSGCRASKSFHPGSSDAATYWNSPHNIPEHTGGFGDEGIIFMPSFLRYNRSVNPNVDVFEPHFGTLTGKVAAKIKVPGLYSKSSRVSEHDPDPPKTTSIPVLPRRATQRLLLRVSTTRHPLYQTNFPQNRPMR